MTQAKQKQMMQPGAYGMPNVRLNLVNIIFAVDLTQARTHYFLASTVTGLIARKFPLRFGIVPLVQDGGEGFGEGVRLAKAIGYLHDCMDWPAATTFMKQVRAFTSFSFLSFSLTKFFLIYNAAHLGRSI